MMNQIRQIGMVSVALILLGSRIAAAMYTPNPAGRWAPQHFFLAGDFQFNDKDLDPDGKVRDMTGFFVRPAFSIAPNAVLYARLGFQDAQDLDTGFAGGFGVQGAYVLPQAHNWAIGGAFDYLHWSSDFSCRDCVSRSIDWNEYQLSTAASYRIPTVPLTPYAGLLFDFVSARDSISERDPVGLLFGANFDPSSHVRLDGQFRVANETGFSFSIGYLF